MANLVAELVGRGRTVLVVGQRRAGLAGLAARLGAVGLDDLVLDIGDDQTSSAAACDASPRSPGRRGARRRGRLRRNGRR